MLKDKIKPFTFFYIILFLFVAYNFIYLVIIWQNKKLLLLFNDRYIFKISKISKVFRDHSFFLIFVLPIIGFLLSAFSFIALCVLQATFLKQKNSCAKLIFLIISFIFIQIGLYITFISQLFYIEWNNAQIVIGKDKSNNVYRAIDFYQHWLTFTQQWIIFAVFFGITVLGIIFIVKIHFFNVEYEHYSNDKSDQDNTINYNWKSPILTNFEFNPDETQTITISLDDTYGKTSKIKLKKPQKKK